MSIGADMAMLTKRTKKTESLIQRIESLPNNYNASSLARELRQSLARAVAVAQDFFVLRGEIPEGSRESIVEYISQTLAAVNQAARDAVAAIDNSAPTDPALSTALSDISGELSMAQKSLGGLGLAARGLIESIKLRSQVTQLDVSEIERRKLAFDEKISEVEENAKVVQQGAKVVQQAAGVISYDKALTLFEERANHHACGEARWLKAAIGSVVILVVVVMGIYFHQPTNSAPLSIGIYGAKNVLALVTASFVVKVALRNWSNQRDLTILYRHRSASLQLYHVLGESVKEDGEARRNLQAEMVRMIFQDPKTGGAEHERSDPQVSPILNVIGKVADTVSGKKVG